MSFNGTTYSDTGNYTGAIQLMAHGAPSVSH